MLTNVFVILLAVVAAVLICRALKREERYDLPPQTPDEAEDRRVEESAF